MKSKPWRSEPLTMVRRPNEVECMLLERSGDNLREVAKWCGAYILEGDKPGLVMSTQGFWRTAYLGHWVAKDELGRFHIYTVEEMKELFQTKKQHEKDISNVKSTNVPDEAADGGGNPVRR